MYTLLTVQPLLQAGRPHFDVILITIATAYSLLWHKVVMERMRHLILVRWLTEQKPID